jgi:hypothetical protein
MLNVLAAAELPMNANCGFTCADVLGEFGGYFRVPLSQLMAGYTFPTVADANQPGYPVAWSGQSAGPLNPLAPFTNFVNSLMADPSTNPIQTVSLQDVITTSQMLTNANNVAFNWWFGGSYAFTGIPTLYAFPILINGLINGLINPANCDPTCGPLPTSESATTIPALVPVATFLNMLAGATTSPTLLTQLLPGQATSAATVRNLLAGGTTSPMTISTLAAPSVLPNMSAKTVTVTTNSAPQAPATEPGSEAQAGAPGEGPAVAGATAPDSTVKNVVTRVQENIAPPAADDGLNQAIEAPTPPSTARTAPSTNVVRDGNKAQPGQVGGNGTIPGGRLAGALNSVSEQIGSVMPKLGAKPGNASSTEGTGSGTEGTGK